MQRVGAEAACWAHNPKVGGSKPSLAITFDLDETYTLGWDVGKGNNRVKTHRIGAGAITRAGAKDQVPKTTNKGKCILFILCDVI